MGRFSFVCLFSDVSVLVRASSPWQGRGRVRFQPRGETPAPALAGDPALYAICDSLRRDR